MLNALLNLFGRSPFAPLQAHMDRVASCVHMLPSLFEALKKKDTVGLTQIAESISEMEHLADLTKNDIRNNMPKGLYLPIERSQLLEILSIQDRIADTAEDVAVLITLKPLTFLSCFEADFDEYLQKNIDAFDEAHRIIKEINELLESSFGGKEAQHVRSMVENVSYKEHEVDLVQRRLLKQLFQAEDQLNFTSFDLWQRIFQATGAISNLSENLAHRVRMTLELK